MADDTRYDPQGRSPEEIRRDIQRTRADMDETVDALGERLSPGRIVDELWQRFRQNDGASGLGDMAREHPVPLALMGLGLGWLAVERATGGSGQSDNGHMGPGTWERAEGRRGPYRGDAVRHGDPDWPHTGTGARLGAKASELGEHVSEGAHGLMEKGREMMSGAAERARDLKDGASDKAHGAMEGASERTHGMMDSVSERAHGMKEGASERLHDVGDRIGETASDLNEQGRRAAARAAEEARHRARQARQGFWNLMEENPSVVGAIAFGLGLASGLVAPSTGVEDRLMGRTADTLKDEARRMASETAESAKVVAQETAEAVKEEVRAVAHDEEDTARSAIERVQEAGRRIAETAAETARTTAEDEGLAPEALADEARTASQRTAEQARRQAGQVRRPNPDRAGRGSGRE